MLTSNRVWYTEFYTLLKVSHILTWFSWCFIATLAVTIIGEIGVVHEFFQKSMLFLFLSRRKETNSG